MENKSLISLVSLGPGDPELMTLKAVRRLLSSDAVYCPATLSENGSMTSRAADLVVSAGVPEDRIRLFAVPMERERRLVMDVYRKTAEEIAGAASSGMTVSVAVEGDAGIYASIHYMMDFLVGKGMKVDQLCGIPSFIAAAAEAGLLLIGREERMVVIPGNASAGELESYLATSQIPVIMKLPRCSRVLKEFMEAHPEHIYHYFENVGLPDNPQAASDGISGNGTDSGNSTGLPASRCRFMTTDRQTIIGREFPYFSLMVIRPGKQEL